VSDASRQVRQVELTAGALRFRDSGQGRPIVFLHGLFPNSTLWRGVIQPLQDTYRCLAPICRSGRTPVR
jgi:pimeloyl-ACP methyl ester carboxylesterase